MTNKNLYDKILEQTELDSQNKDYVNPINNLSNEPTYTTAGYPVITDGPPVKAYASIGGGGTMRIQARNGKFYINITETT